MRLISSVLVLLSVLYLAQAQQTCICQLYDNTAVNEITYMGGSITPDETCSVCSSADSEASDLAPLCNFVYDPYASQFVLQTQCNPFQAKTWLGKYEVQMGSTCITSGLFGACYPPCDIGSCNCFEGNVYIDEDIDNPDNVILTATIQGGYNLTSTVNTNASFLKSGNGGVLLSGVFLDIDPPLGWDIIRMGDGSLNLMAWQDGPQGVPNTCSQTALQPSSSNIVLLVVLLVAAGVVVAVGIYFCCFRKKKTADTQATAQNPQIQANSAPYTILPPENRKINVRS